MRDEHEQQAPPWARQDGEPLRWFARFEAFRLAGAQRSLLAIYNAERASAGKRAAQTVPAPWNEHAQRWHWRARCEAFDRHQLEQQREAAELAYQQAIDAHRQRARQFAEQAHGVSSAMLAVLGERLDTLAPEELGVGHLATLARAAAAVSTAALEGEAQALGVEELLKALEEHEREQSKHQAA